MEFEFTLTLTLPADDDSDVHDFIERLGAAGCTDALLPKHFRAITPTHKP